MNGERPVPLEGAVTAGPITLEWPHIRVRLLVVTKTVGSREPRVASGPRTHERLLPGVVTHVILELLFRQTLVSTARPRAPVRQT
jgi:hypothetical protein